MSSNEFLKSIGITQVGFYDKDGSYVIDLYSSDDFGHVYSILNNSEEIEQDENSSLLTLNNSSLIYYNEDFQLVLIADFYQDTYKLTCKEV